jgi:hypothetical protein
VLHLPDVAELVGHEVVGDVGATQEDHTLGGEAVVALPGRQPEEPRGHDQPDTLDADGPRPPIESVEPRLGASQPGVGGFQGAVVTGSRSKIAPPSWLWV